VEKIPPVFIYIAVNVILIAIAAVAFR